MLLYEWLKSLPASEHAYLARALGLITDDPAEAQRRLAAAERLLASTRRA